MRLSDLYDADERAKEHIVARTASRHRIPHPLPGVQYADGVGAWDAGREVTDPWLAKPDCISRMHPRWDPQPADVYGVLVLAGHEITDETLKQKVWYCHKCLEIVGGMFIMEGEIRV